MGAVVKTIAKTKPAKPVKCGAAARRFRKMKWGRGWLSFYAERAAQGHRGPAQARADRYAWVGEARGLPQRQWGLQRAYKAHKRAAERESLTSSRAFGATAHSFAASTARCCSSILGICMTRAETKAPGITSARILQTSAIWFSTRGRTIRGWRLQRRFCLRLPRAQHVPAAAVARRAVYSQHKECPTPDDVLIV